MESIIERAIAEQIKSHGPEEGLEDGRRGTIATCGQIAGYRRSTETVLIDMCDRIAKKRKALETQKAAAKHRRNRRRGPRSINKLQERRERGNMETTGN